MTEPDAAEDPTEEAARARIDERLTQLEALDLDDRAWRSIRYQLNRVDELGPVFVAGYLGWALANPRKVGNAAPRNP